MYRTFGLSEMIISEEVLPTDFLIRLGSWDEDFQIVTWTNQSPVKEEKEHIWWVTILKGSRQIHCIIFPKADNLLTFENFDHSKVLAQKSITFPLVQDQYAKVQTEAKSHTTKKFYNIFWVNFI